MTTVALENFTEPRQEKALLELARRLTKTSGPGNRTAVHIRLSAFPPHLRREHHVRIAASAFDSLLERFDGRVFTLSNSDLMLVAGGPAKAEIGQAVGKLQNMFVDPPAVHDQDSGSLSGFVTWYDIDDDTSAFLKLCIVLADDCARDDKANVFLTGSEATADAPKALDPKALDRLTGMMANLDIAPFLCRQPVGLLMPGQALNTVYTEVYVSIADLQRELMPEVELTENRWLFQSLTEHLDRLVLELAADKGIPNLSGAFSLNLNVSSLLSSEFLALEGAIRERANGTIIFELQNIDMFSDMAAYVFARDFVRDRGYRVCLDGLTHLNFPFINRERLGADMIKICWNPIMERSFNKDKKSALKSAVLRTDSARVVLCHCDSRDAVEWGHSVGISLFQGYFVDTVLANHAKTDAGAEADSA